MPKVTPEDFDKYVEEKELDEIQFTVTADMKPKAKEFLKNVLGPLYKY